MTKPLRATRIAVLSASASEIVPSRRSAAAHPRTVPGTPTERPLYRASLNASGLPFSMNESGPAPPGARAPRPPDGGAAVPAVVERQRLAVLHERVRPHARRRGLAVVDRRD